MKIDLKELSVRESERVEWKENVADITDVVRTIVAFSNDLSNLGGGYVVCGAKETRDEHGFQKLELVGLTASRLKEVENHVLAHCRDRVSPPIVPVIDEIPLADSAKRILVFVVPSSGQAHEYRSDAAEGAKYFVRIGRETREARNGLLRELLVRKRALEPWDRRPNANATIKDIDLIVLRDLLQQMGLWDPQKGLEDYLSPSDQLSSFVPPLTAALGVDNVTHPRNFTLLFFSSKPIRLIPGAFSIFSIYRGQDRSEPTAERVEVTGTISEQARKLIELLNTEAYTAFDKTDEQPNQVKYPRRALQEAVVNALAHRDYESEQPIRVTVFIDRIEIVSPGALPYAVDPDKFRQGRAPAYWRNQALAYFLNKLQLAQAEGQGIPTIIRTMHEEGCPPPVFELGEESVTCILPAHPRHALMRDLNDIENQIILGNHESALARLESLLERDPYNFRSLELFCEVNGLMKTPERVFAFLKRMDLDPKLINSGTLLVVAETLLGLKENSEARKLAHRLLAQAMSGRLEESEVKRIALNYRKMKSDDKAIELIQNVIKRSPALATSASLRDMAARAKIDLAKKCMETARSKHMSRERKAKAWNLCRSYLSDADTDLKIALEHVKNDVDREYIQRDLDFLRYMQDLARRPDRPKAGVNGADKQQARRRLERKFRVRDK